MLCLVYFLSFLTQSLVSFDCLLKWWFLELVGATWCVCRDGLADTVLQKTLDFACGAGADCVPIHQNGGCYLPNTVKAHCSFATNSYFQRKGQAPGSCDFSGTAAVTTSDPSKILLSAIS